jgi:hypothetical protein
VTRGENQTGGYPPWLINEMVQLENPNKPTEEELAAAAEAMMIKDAEARRKEREELVARTAAAADASTKLPDASQEVLKGEETDPVL